MNIAAHDGKTGCNIVEYVTAFLHSDCLYFLWHDIIIGYFTVGERVRFLFATCANNERSE